MSRSPKPGESGSAPHVRPHGSGGGRAISTGHESASGEIRGGRPRSRPAESFTPEGQAARTFVDQITTSPLTVKGKSAQQLADQFTAAGYTAYPEQTRKAGTSGNAVQVRVSGHPMITNIEVHPGGGRHTPEGSPYWRISMNENGRIWVIPGDFRGADMLRGQVVRYDE